MIADDSADPTLVVCDLLGQAERQLAALPTRDVASQSWRDNGIVVAASDAAEAVRISDDYAPEHLELHVADTAFFTERLCNYGSLFIGEETTVAYGDKTIGANHILPTSREASREVGEVTERQCIRENMLAHGITARLRMERYGGGRQ